jgi:hypothetical protein
MEERFSGRKLWFGLGALALIFLCLMVCGLAVLALAPVHLGPAYGVAPYVQPPAAGGGAAPVPVYQYSLGPLGILAAGVGLIFKLIFFGLLLLLVFGLVRRLFWRRWFWYPPYRGTPPEGQEGEGAGPWGPWYWRHHHRHCGPPPWWTPETEAGAGKEKPQESNPAE